MKKIVLLVLSLCLVVVGCSKPSSEIKPVVSSETVDESKKIIPIEDERIEKAKEYDEYIKQKQLEIREQEKIHQKNMPYYATSEDLNKNQIRSRYIKSYFEKLSDGEVAEFSPIPVTDVVRDERYCTCKFKIKTFGGNELEYKATLKRDPYREEFNDRTKHHEKDYYEFDPDAYYLVEMELLSDVESPKITNNFLNTQIKYMSDYVDYDKERLVKLFEDYENEHYPLYLDKDYTKVGKLKVVDYVKVNLTGSDCDEYLVLFANKIDDSACILDRIRCVQLSENRIVNDYDIILDYYGYTLPYQNNRMENKNNGLSFSRGFICDCNQNGVNEIYFYTESPGIASVRLYFIEFDGDMFNVFFITNEEGFNFIKLDEKERAPIVSFFSHNFVAHAYSTKLQTMVAYNLNQNISMLLDYYNNSEIIFKSYKETHN